jgi:hypothetical protein
MIFIMNPKEGSAFSYLSISITTCQFIDVSFDCWKLQCSLETIRVYHNLKLVIVCDNDLKYRWSRDRENDVNIGDVRIFRQVQPSRRIIALGPLFLYYSCQLVLCCSSCCGVPVPLLLYQGDDVIRKLTELVTT